MVEVRVCCRCVEIVDGLAYCRIHHTGNYKGVLS